MNSALLETGLFAAHDLLPAFIMMRNIDIRDNFNTLEEALCEFPEWVRT